MDKLQISSLSLHNMLAEILQEKLIQKLRKHLPKPDEQVLSLYSPGLEDGRGLWGCLYARMVAVPSYTWWTRQVVGSIPAWDTH